MRGQADFIHNIPILRLHAKFTTDNFKLFITVRWLRETAMDRHHKPAVELDMDWQKSTVFFSKHGFFCISLHFVKNR